MAGKKVAMRGGTEARGEDRRGTVRAAPVGLALPLLLAMHPVAAPPAGAEAAVWIEAGQGLAVMVAGAAEEAWPEAALENAEAVAVDEEGGAVWSFGGGRLRVHGLDGELLLERRLPPARGDAVRLVAEPGRGRAWLGFGERLYHLDVSGDLLAGLEVPAGTLDLALDEVAGAAATVLLGERRALPKRALASYRARAPETREAFQPIDLRREAAGEGAGATPGEPALGGDDEALGQDRDFLARGGAPCDWAFDGTVSPSTGLTSEPDWSETIDATAVFDDGTGPALYVGGSFQYAGGRRVNYIAKWDGTTWESLGAGFNFVVEALVVHDDGTGPKLYAAGGFDQAGTLQVNAIARWDGDGWSRVGFGFNGEVHALAVFDDGTGPALYAAGNFTTANYGFGWHGEYLGVTARWFARWDGELWQPLPFEHDFPVYGLGAFDDGGGEALFLAATEGIYRWDGAAFTLTLDNGTFEPPSYAFATFDAGGGERLYTSIWGTVYEWNGAGWTPVPGSGGLIRSLAVFDEGTGSQLYVGGDFSTFAGLPAAYVARWDGSSWSVVGEGLDASVRALAGLVEGGQPTLFAGMALSDESRLARWRGAAWERFDGGEIDYPIYALARFDDGTGEALYAGGALLSAGGVAVSRIGRWDGSGWSALGLGVNSFVRALFALDDGTGEALYVGGEFTQAGGVAASRIARWTGSSWEPLGAGFSTPVRALVVHDDGTGPALYAAGGDLPPYGGAFVARWDGLAWQMVATPTSGTVFALASYDAGSGPALYAGGSFTSIGGVAASRIARWDGTAWSALGAGTDLTVRSLAVFDDGSGPRLYAGGEFMQAGGVERLRIARWNGTSWAGFGSAGFGPASSDPDEAVHALGVFDFGSGPMLVVAGGFTTRGSEPVGRLAASRTGASWMEFGEGINGPVYALLAGEEAGEAVVYAAGQFSSADGEGARRLARLYRPAACPAPAILLASPELGALTTQPSVAFAGSLSEPGSLWLNDQRIVVAPDFSFQRSVALHEGLNEFTLLAAWPEAFAQLEVPVTRDSVPPEVRFTSPAAGTTVHSARPELRLVFGDEGTGLVRASLALFRDGVPLAADCTGGAGIAVCVPAADLPVGPVSLTATIDDLAGNVGESPVLALTVAPAGSLLTTVVGEVRLPGGSPASGATVSVLGVQGASALSAGDGSFSIPAVAVPTAEPLSVVAQLRTEAEPLFASATVPPVPGGVTDAGVLTLAVGCGPAFAEAFSAGVGIGGTATGIGTAGEPRVQALAVWDDGMGPALYVGGDFTRAGGVDAPYLARWDGATWSEVGGGTDGPVYALAVYDDGTGPALFVGGLFTEAGGVPASRIAKWDGAAWSSLGAGVGNGPCTLCLVTQVHALAVFDEGQGPRLFVGGLFTAAGGQPAGHIARWDGASWSSVGGGVDSSAGLLALPFVHALLVWDDGTGPALYAGGRFDRAGGLVARHVARWDGGQWSPLGYGVGSGSSNTPSVGVMALAVYDDGTGPALYAGGLFDYAGASGGHSSVARWDGEHWWGVGGGLSTSGIYLEVRQGVQALAVFDDGTGAKLYAAGEIDGSGGRPLRNLAAWDGASWQPVGAGLDAGGYGGMALAVFDEGAGPRLFVGGGFSLAGEAAASGIARWDGERYSALGEGTSGALHAFTVFDDGTGPALFAGGDFLAIGGVRASRVARWDGRAWSAVGEGLPRTVHALEFFDDGAGPRLYAGGAFGTVGMTGIDGVAVWDGEAWQEVGGGVGGGTAYDLAVWDDGAGEALYATGSFTTAGGLSAGRITRWDGVSWSALGAGGLGGDGRALAVWDDGAGEALYVAGAFTSAGGVAANRVARWDGSAWAPLGSGLSNTAHALQVFDDGTGEALYVGGEFGSAGGGSANRVARWSGTSWSGLGTGLFDPLGNPSAVYSLAAYDDGRGPALYAGGRFTTAGGQPASHVARWDGAAWSPLRAGADGPVWALAVFDDGGGPALFVGGVFGEAGGVASGYLARWRSPLACGPEGLWDVTPPAVAWTAPTAGAILATTTPTLAVTYADAGSGVEPASLGFTLDGNGIAVSCSLGPGAATCTPSAPLQNGSHTLGATIADRVGNVSPVAALAVTVDTVPPALSFAQPPEGAVVTTATPGLQLAWSDATSGIDTATLALERDGQAFPVSCSFSPTSANCTPVSPLAGGPTTLTATVRDLAGNLSAVAQVSFTVLLAPPPDTTPPVVFFLEPVELEVFDPNAQPMRLVWGDVGAGIDRGSLRVELDGEALPLNCTLCTATATCTLDEPVAGDVLIFRATVRDLAGNLSQVAEVRFPTRPGIDLTPPAITLLSPLPGSITANPEAWFAGSVSEPATLTLNGAPVTLDAGNAFTHGPVPLVEGLNAFTLVATDPAGNESQLNLTVTLDTERPDPLDPVLVTVSEAPAGVSTITGAPGCVPDPSPGKTVQARNLTTGGLRSAAVSADGSFSGNVPALAGDRLALTVRGANGLESDPRLFTVPGSLPTPPDPAAVAPPLDPTVATGLCAAASFLWSGDSPVQYGVEPGEISCERIALLRGRVLDRAGAPLSGVRLIVLGHPEFGTTLSRPDGLFDLAVEGGGALVVQYRLAGHFTLQRTVAPAWREFATVPDVALTPPDAQVTVLTLPDPGSLQVARGSQITDADGSRQPTLLFPAGTAAAMELPDGTSQALTSLSVRATEYTTGDLGREALPGALPAGVAYTCAVELSVDEAEAAGAHRVVFSQAVPAYLENFLGFEVGQAIPAAYYDRERSLWVPSANGLVIEMLSSSGGLAELDLTGSGQPATPSELAALGVADAERVALAGLYQPGSTLWRVPVDHFTPWTFGWPFGYPLGALAPDLTLPESGDDGKLDKPAHTLFGGTIETSNQILGQSLAVTGTPFRLHYRSDRVPGRKAPYRLFIPLSDASLPPMLQRIDVEIDVAGQHVTASFPPQPSQSTTFEWDGRDRFGRPVQGEERWEVKLGYVYDGEYQVPHSGNPAFGVVSGVRIEGSQTRREVTISRESSGKLGSLDALGAFGLGGWSLSVHHAFDSGERTLYFGDGRRRNFGSGRSEPSVLARVAGTGLQGVAGDGGEALDAQLKDPRGLSLTRDGGLLIADSGNCRIRKVDAGGQISTVAGTDCSPPPPGGSIGDGGPATSALLSWPSKAIEAPDGSLYIADTGHHRIRKVEPDGTIQTFAGTGVAGCTGDRGEATSAQLYEPDDVALDAAGNLLISEYGSPFFGCRALRRVGADGTITTVADGDQSVPEGDSTPFPVVEPEGIAAGEDGSVYFTQLHAMRRMPPDRQVDPQHPGWSLAGVGYAFAAGFAGDGEEGGLDTRMNRPRQLALARDRTLYFADSNNGRIRRISATGIVSTVAGGGALLPVDDGLPAAQAALLQPVGVAVDPTGETLYLSDAARNQVWRMTPPEPFGDSEFAIASEDGAVLYVFDSEGRHRRTESAVTGEAIVTFTYTAYPHPEDETREVRLLTRVEDAFGNRTEIERDEDGKPTAIVAPFGQRTELATHPESGYLTEVRRALIQGEERVLLGATEDGLLTSLRDPRQGLYGFTYDGEGRLSQVEDPADGSLTLAFEETNLGHRVTQTTAEGRTSKVAVDFLGTGEVRQTTTSASGLEVTTLRKPDQSLTLTYPDETVVTLEKAPDPRLGVQAPYAKKVILTTPGEGLVYQMATERAVTVGATDPLTLLSHEDSVTVSGRTGTTRYTASDRKLVATSPEGRAAEAFFDTFGRVVERRVPGIEPVRYAYDAKGRLASMEQGPPADPRTVTYTYGVDGDLEAVTDPLDREVRFEHDRVGRVTTKVLPDGREVRFTYDLNGNVTSIRPPSRPEHGFDHTPVDRVESYAPPDVLAGPDATLFAYNDDHQLTLVTRPDGQTVGFGYDSGGRLASLALPEGALTYAYDGETGQLDTITAPDGGTTAYDYDGPVVESVTLTGAAPGLIELEVDRSPAGSQQSNFWLASRRLNGDEATRIDFEYDDDGLLTEAGELELFYDPANGLLQGSEVRATGDRYERTAFGEISHSEAGVDDGSCTGSGSPWAGCVHLLEIDYQRDDLGRIEEKEETLRSLGGPAETHTFDYTYDDAGRLTAVTRDGAPWASYAYDGNSNRVAWTDPWGSGTATCDDQDRLLTYGDQTYTYTANGELLTKTQNGQTVTYTYDVLGNLRRVVLPDGVDVEYVIDGRQRRIGKKVNGTLVKGFLYKDGLAPLAELDGAGALVAQFVYGTRANVPDYLVKGGQTYRLMADHLGSVRLGVNATTGEIAQRLDYDAFGRVLYDSNPGFQPFGFAGGLYDPQTGLVQFGARDYDAETGRWTTKDPIGFGGGDTNLYGYVVNDPVNLADPLGEAIFLKVHPVGFGNYHTAVVIFPDDQARYVNDPRFVSTDEGGRYATLGAGPDDGFLVSGLNRERDANLDFITDLIRIDLGTRYEDQVIEQLFATDAAYRDSLDYDLLPARDGERRWWVRDDGFNSNSYTRGLLEAVGLPTPLPGVAVPGYDKPVPPGEFGIETPP